jgi:hypothetical protein
MDEDSTDEEITDEETTDEGTIDEETTDDETIEDSASLSRSLGSTGGDSILPLVGEY